MFIVVCYDIPDDKRRNKVGKLLEGFGARVQKSVFECDLTSKQTQHMKQRMAKILKNTEDSVRYYSLCAQCVTKVEIINGPPVTENPVSVWSRIMRMGR